MTTDMIGMCMGSYSCDRLIEQILSGFQQARNTHAGIDHQISLFTAHMPDIATH
jgi:hypothetical protein